MYPRGAQRGCRGISAGRGAHQPRQGDQEQDPSSWAVFAHVLSTPVRDCGSRLVILHQTVSLVLLLLYSEESERVSLLKSISGSSRLPYGTLAFGAEGIKYAIKLFDELCVLSYFLL